MREIDEIAVLFLSSFPQRQKFQWETYLEKGGEPQPDATRARQDVTKARPGHYPGAAGKRCNDGEISRGSKFVFQTRMV